MTIAPNPRTRITASGVVVEDRRPRRESMLGACILGHAWVSFAELSANEVWIMRVPGAVEVGAPRPPKS